MSDEYAVLKRPEMAPEEEDAIAAQVNRDMAEGNAAKHFEDVLDELHSTQHQETNAPTADEREQMRRDELALLRQLKRDASEQLLGQGMRVSMIYHSATGGDYEAQITDAVGRVYIAHISYAESIPRDAHNAEELYRGMVDLLVQRSLAARAKYFDRMKLEVSS
jgi:hypothetical protein